MRRLGTLAVATALATACAVAPQREARMSTGFLFRTLEEDGRRFDYAVYVPRGYDRSRPWPLILFLHGRGESGTDGSRQLAQGLPREILWHPDRWPFIVVVPQKPEEDAEWERYERELMAVLGRTRRDINADPARLVLTGLSQGGHGAWVLGARHPELWAAVVPVCGYAAAHWEAPGVFTGDPRRLAAPLAATPVWAFHGEDDDTVPVGETRAMIGALEAAGGRPRVTIYPGVGHDSWDRAYADPELPRWLLAQRKPEVPFGPATAVSIGAP